MAEKILIGGGNELSLLQQCAQACVENGGDWYTAPQALAILGDFVGKPALLADAAFIGMATPERILRLLDQQSDLLEVVQALLTACDEDFITNTSHADSVGVLANAARAAIAKATENRHG